jgi:hypothetical protein
MTDDHRSPGCFWAHIPATGDLRLASTAEDLLDSLLPHPMPSVLRFEERAEARFVEACRIADEAQAQIRHVATMGGQWSSAGATMSEITRLTRDRRVPDEGGEWPRGSVRLVVVVPWENGAGWTPPVGRVTVIDHTSSLALLRGYVALGLIIGGRLDQKSPVEHPRGW